VPVVDPKVVAFLGEVNTRLQDSATAIDREVRRTSLQPGDVRLLVGQVAANVTIGMDAVTSLGGALGDEEPGGRLAAQYVLIDGEATQTLDASVRNDGEYRVGGRELVKLIGGLAVIQADLETLLLASPPASPSASAGSPAPSSPPPSSAPPSASASPSGSAAPSGEIPSGSQPPFVPGGPEPSRAPDEQIENGGFEDPADQSWGLATAPGANAVLTFDPEQPGTGILSARVDIPSSRDAFADIALRQSGLQLEIGRNYTVSFNVRATASRQIRIKVMPAFGGSYQTRDFDVTTAWTPVSFTFFATDFDPAAAFEIQLGRSTATTWIDTVSFRPTPAF
jgi:hypothetical protein